MSAPTTIDVEVIEFNEAHKESIEFYGESAPVDINASAVFYYDGECASMSFDEDVKSIFECVPALKQKVLLNMLLEVDVPADAIINPVRPDGDEVKWSALDLCEFLQITHWYTNSDEVIASLIEYAETIWNVRFVGDIINDEAMLKRSERKINHLSKIVDTLRIDNCKLTAERNQLIKDNQILSKELQNMQERCADLEDEIQDMKRTKKFLTSEEAGRRLAQDMTGGVQ